MLRRKNIEMAMGIANNGAANGRLFSPRSDTPVHILNLSMKPVIVEDGQDPVSVIAEASEDSYQGAVQLSSHSGGLTALAGQVANRLRGNLKHIRNEITPLIEEISEACSKAEADIRADSPINMSIVHVPVPEIYQTATLEEMLERYVGRPSADPGPREGLTNRIARNITPETFIEMVNMPSASFNDAVAGIISTIVADSGIVPLFQKTPSRGLGLYKDFSSVLTFLFLRAFNAGKHPEINPADLESEDRIYLARLVAFYGKQSEQTMRFIEDDLKTPNFAFLDASIGGKVYVNDIKYRRWLKEGGSLEAVIGHFYNAKTTGYDLEGLINNPKKYEDVFNRAERLHSSNQRSLGAQEAKRITKKMLMSYVVEAKEDDPGMISPQETADWFGSNEIYSNDDRDKYITKAVCQTVGRDYDAMVILTEMQNFLDQEGNEEMLVEDAAAFAVTKMLARWFAGQIDQDVIKESSFRNTIASFR